MQHGAGHGACEVRTRRARSNLLDVAKSSRGGVRVNSRHDKPTDTAIMESLKWTVPGWLFGRSPVPVHRGCVVCSSGHFLAGSRDVLADSGVPASAPQPASWRHWPMCAENRSCRIVRHSKFTFRGRRRGRV